METVSCEKVSNRLIRGALLPTELHALIRNSTFAPVCRGAALDRSANQPSNLRVIAANLNSGLPRLNTKSAINDVHRHAYVGVLVTKVPTLATQANSKETVSL